MTEHARSRRKTTTGLRVTGGALAGRRIRVPRTSLRPTSERVREALFARLPELEAVAALDLYAGSGALGFEALSRGAESVVFVESDRVCLAALRANAEALGVSDRVRVMAGDAVGVLGRLGRSGERFGLVLLDPPYAAGELARALPALVSAGVVVQTGSVVVERERRHPLPDVVGLALVDERRYGDTVIARLEADVGGADADVDLGVG